MFERIPDLGNWLAPKDGSLPGMVVAVLPSGNQYSSECTCGLTAPRAPWMPESP